MTPHGWSVFTRRSQYTYAQNIPSAPWAKLKMPDVEYVTTSPQAAMANTAPVTRPLMSRFTRCAPDSRRVGAVLRGDPVGVPLGCRHPVGLEVLDQVLGVAVEAAAGRNDRVPLGAVELQQESA